MPQTKHLNIILARGHGDKHSNLPAVRATARALGLPPKLPFKTVHIAGTNGKGTVAALLALTLQNAGLRTGLFISPHVYDVGERAQINGAKISLKKLDFYLSQVLAKETKKLNFFEAITLAALLHFKAQKVDVAVIECGLGGLRDSTNFIAPALSVITSVAIDHADILGRTLPKIAAQKAGVIKPLTPCICGPLPRAAIAAVKKQARAQASPLLMLPAAKTFGQNANIARAAAKMLGVKEKHFKPALKTLRLPARFEICPLAAGKKIIKDGAHNPAAIKNFIKTYKKSPYYAANNTLIYAAAPDKDYAACLKLLAPHFKSIILTQAPGCAPAKTLKTCLKTAQTRPLSTLNASALKKMPGHIIALGSFRLAARLPGRPS